MDTIESSPGWKQQLLEYHKKKYPSAATTAKTWVGLFNPTDADCTSNSNTDPSPCNDKLVWADGNYYRYEDVPSINNIELVDGSDHPFGITMDVVADEPTFLEAVKGTPENPFPYLCEFTC